MPAKPIRLLHLSDFQVGKEPYAQHALFEPIIEAVRERKAAGAAPDMLLISGDIAFSAQPAQYREFTEHFLLPLSEVLGDTVWERTFVVPGNHDVDRGKARLIMRIRDTILAEVPLLLNPNDQGLAERGDLLPRFQAFRSADLPAPNAWIETEAGCATHVVELHGQRVGLLLLNTAWLAGDEKDRRKLSPGLPIVTQALENLRGCDATIVLGHHPIDWFVDDELNDFYKLFGQHRVIYLHGHTDTNALGQEEGAGYSFVSLRAASACRVSAAEKRVSGISWYELDIPAHSLSAAAQRWSAEASAWVPDTELLTGRYYNHDLGLWQFALPSATRDDDKRRSDGWELIDTAFLARHQLDPGDERAAEAAQHYFDGAHPDWHTILSYAPTLGDQESAPYVPRRAMVGELKQTLEDARHRGTVDVTLLTGAIGEGKSTVLRQVVCDLARDSERWTVVWHSDPAEPLLKSFLTNDLPRSRVYLIVADDAEPIAKNVFEIANWLRASKHRNFHFLLCCRDTDWIAARGNDLLDRFHDVLFTQKTLRGLTLPDATRIVGAWQRLGKAGLRELHAEPFDAGQAAQRFVAEARSEKHTTIGAFLGALLRVRFGENLKAHVEQLLWKLYRREAPPKPDGNLMDAFAYIAAMHAENLLFLSKPVLAEVLHCTAGELQNQVIKPLGAEAFVSAGRLMLTRHRLIAKAAVDILSNELLGELAKDSFEDLYAELACAAEELHLARAPREYVEGFRALPDELFKNGNSIAAIHTAQALLARWPSNLVFLVNLSKLYRRDGTPDRAVQLFREPERQPYPYDRACYNEWATAEGMIGRPHLDVWLSGMALADDVERGIRLAMAVMALNGLTIAFHRVFRESNNQTRLFIEACGATAQIVRQLDYSGRISSKDAWNQVNDCMATCEEYGVQPAELDTAMQIIEAGIQSAANKREANLPAWKWLPGNSPLVFTELRAMIGA